METEDANKKAKPKKKLNPRMLSALLENRKLAWAMVVGSSIYLLASLLGSKVSFCPTQNVLGLKCPGCGMTSGMKALLRGDLAKAIELNWLTPIMALFWTALIIGLFLPKATRKNYIRIMQTSEDLTKWPLILGCAGIIYALTRNIWSL